MTIFTRMYYLYRKIIKAIKLFLIVSGPGIIVMIADNDAGGITTYAATGAKYGYNLIWVLILLTPDCYYVQEMTVRLGAFWGWFLLLGLLLVNWLTMVMEFIGMASALKIFGIPPYLTVIVMCAIRGAWY